MVEYKAVQAEGVGPIMRHADFVARSLTAARAHDKWLHCSDSPFCLKLPACKEKLKQSIIKAQSKAQMSLTVLL